MSVELLPETPNLRYNIFVPRNLVGVFERKRQTKIEDETNFSIERASTFIRACFAYIIPYRYHSFTILE